MSRSDHSRSRKHPAYHSATHRLWRAHRHAVRQMLRQGAIDLPPTRPRADVCGHGCCF